MWRKFVGKFKRSALVAALLVAVGFPATAQRSLDNVGFELNDPGGAGTPTFEFFADSNVPNWEDQTGTIEIWDSGFLSVPSYAGDRHAEVNAKSPGALYQAICMESGESFDYSFAHRHRSGGPNNQRIVFELKNIDGSDINTNANDDIVRRSTVRSGDGWVVRTGTTTYTGPSGLKRFQFRALSSGSVGNFVDEIEVFLTAYAEMNADLSQPESTATGPSIVVMGTIETSVDLGFTVSGGTATLGDDYTVDASAVTIPAGTYFDTVFNLPITILNDGVFEADETIIIDIGTPSNSELRIATADCVSSPDTQQVYTIEDDDPDLSGSKSIDVYDPDPLDGIPVYAVPGNDVRYTIEIENAGNGPVDNNGLLLVDRLPSEITFYNGDIDDGGPETDPVAFAQTGAGLSFSYASDVGFSNAASAPTDFSSCSYVPAAGYDPAVRYVCISPSGAMAAGSPAPQASFSFRARIK